MSKEYEECKKNTKIIIIIIKKKRSKEFKKSYKECEIKHA